MIIKILRTLGAVAGIALIALGAGRVLFPIDTIPGGNALNPSLDTETRAGGALLIAFGCSYVWATCQWPIPSALLRFLAATMALLAVARVISMVDTGMPHWIFVASTAVEFTAAALTYWYSTMRDDQSRSGADRRPGLAEHEPG